MLGSDIVDLGDASIKTDDNRFKDRVFTELEKQYINQAGKHAHLYLWRLWAAKEASYKAYQKLHLTHRFCPRLCQLSKDSLEILLANVHRDCYGKLLLNNTCLNLKWVNYKNAVICYALLDNDNFSAIDTKVLVTDEAYCYSKQSQLAKALIKELYYSKGLYQVEMKRALLQIDDYQKKGPPYLYQENEKLNHQISISHDGCYIMASMLISSFTDNTINRPGSI